MSNTLIPCWDHNGKVHELDGFPESFGDWELGGPVAPSPSTSSLLKAIQDAVHQPVISTRLLSENINKVALRLKNLPTSDSPLGPPRHSGEQGGHGDSRATTP
jgi:hypothetical protein